MPKHNANVDIRGDLRVRGRVEDNLRVADEVEAAAFYIRDVGELTIVDTSVFTLVDGSRDFTGDQSMGGNRITSLGAPVSPDDAARLQDISSAAGFYGITVAQTNELQSFSGINTIKFESTHFYLTRNVPQQDEVHVNLLVKNVENVFSAAFAESGTQTIGSGSAVKLSEWDQILRNKGGWQIDTSGNITVPEGITHYQAVIGVRFNTSGATNTGFRQVLLANSDASAIRDENGDDYAIPFTSVPPVASSSSLSRVNLVTGLIPCNGGEEIAVYAQHNQGADVDVSGGVSGLNTAIYLRGFNLG